MIGSLLPSPAAVKDRAARLMSGSHQLVLELVTGGQRYRARARTATGDEKARLWPDVVDACRGYGGYQRRTDRDIPLVVCERVG